MQSVGKLSQVLMTAIANKSCIVHRETTQHGLHKQTLCQLSVVAGLPGPLWFNSVTTPTAVQAWQPCPLWQLSPSHPILV